MKQKIKSEDEQVVSQPGMHERLIADKKAQQKYHQQSYKHPIHEEYTSPYQAEKWKDEVRGHEDEFHMMEMMHLDRHTGRVYGQLNLKDDEDLRQGDAFLFDHMLDYAYEHQEQPIM